MGRPPKPKRTKSTTSQQEPAPTTAQAELASLLAGGTALVVRQGNGGPNPTAALTPEGYRALTAMAAEGQDQASMAAALGMNKSTLSALIKRDEQAEDALQAGKARLHDELTHHLLRAARKGNIVAAIYLTKARLGWRAMSDDPFELIIVGRDAVTGEPIFAKRRKVPPLAVESGVHADGSQTKASPFGHGRSDRRK